MRTLILLGAIAVATTACGQHEKNAAQASPQAAAPAAPQSEQVFHEGTPFAGADLATDGVTFTVEPSTLGCDAPKGKGVVTVSFDARPAGFKHARVYIQGTNGKQSLWSQSPGAMDARPTGPWMGDGMRFLLVDVDSGKLLAVRTMHAARCP